MVGLFKIGFMYQNDTINLHCHIQWLVPWRKKKDRGNKSDEETEEEITDSIYQDILNESDTDEINTDEELSEDDYGN